jgi:hypothetical protein
MRKKSFALSGWNSITKAISFVTHLRGICEVRLSKCFSPVQILSLYSIYYEDTFTTPEQFAATLCEDMLLPTVHFAPLIVAAINEQLEESRRTALEEHVYTREESGEMDETFWTRWRKRLRPELEGGESREDKRKKTTVKLEEADPASLGGSVDGNGESVSVDSSQATRHDELRVLIKVRCRCRGYYYMKLMSASRSTSPSTH